MLPTPGVLFRGAHGRRGHQGFQAGASPNHRSSVETEMPTTRATVSIGALSGGSNLATTRSFTARPYRAITVPRRCPQGSHPTEATSSLTQGAAQPAVERGAGGEVG